MKRSDTLPSASRSLQAEVGVTEFSAVPACNPFYTIHCNLGSVRRLGAGAGVGPDRAAGHGAGDGVRDGRRCHRSRPQDRSPEGKTRIYSSCERRAGIVETWRRMGVRCIPRAGNAGRARRGPEPRVRVGTEAKSRRRTGRRRLEPVAALHCVGLPFRLIWGCIGRQLLAP